MISVCSRIGYYCYVVPCISCLMYGICAFNEICGGGDIFTSYITCNRLNLETSFLKFFYCDGRKTNPPQLTGKKKKKEQAGFCRMYFYFVSIKFLIYYKRRKWTSSWTYLESSSSRAYLFHFLGWHMNLYLECLLYDKCNWSFSDALFLFKAS